jgi:hypothetical protein
LVEQLRLSRAQPIVDLRVADQAEREAGQSREFSFARNADGCVCWTSYVMAARRNGTTAGDATMARSEGILEGSSLQVSE